MSSRQSSSTEKCDKSQQQSAKCSAAAKCDPQSQSSQQAQECQDNFQPSASQATKCSATAKQSQDDCVRSQASKSDQPLSSQQAQECQDNFQPRASQASECASSSAKCDKPQQYQPTVKCVSSSSKAPMLGQDCGDSERQSSTNKTSASTKQRETDE